MIIGTSDIDIDVKNRDDILIHFKHLIALERITENVDLIKHKNGVYFHEVPVDPLTGVCTIDYKTANMLGFQKIDFLNVHVYDNIKDREELKRLISLEPIWELLEDSEIVQHLFQLSNQISIVQHWKPKSVEELAMLIAMIRPGKFHLIGASSWKSVSSEIWVKPKNDKPYLKKPHAIAYAYAIVAQLNKLTELIASSLEL